MKVLHLPASGPVHCSLQARCKHLSCGKPEKMLVQAFDDLLLVKVGGRVMYHGRIGPSSCNLVQYFEVRSLCQGNAHIIFTGIKG